MKRFSLIFLGALAMLFMVGCSKNNPQPSAPDAWVNDLSLPVPIQFGSTTILQTKAGYESLNDLGGTTFAVFGLAEGSDPILDNEPATLSNGYLDLECGTKYYPKDSENNYTFYAYAPIAATGGLSPVISIGTQDYVWARAKAEPVVNANGVEVNGFNAWYMRTIRQLGVANTHSPNFDFTHVTSGLKVIAVANVSGNDDSSDDDFKNIEIYRVTLRNVMKQGTLDVKTGKVTDLRNQGNILLSDAIVNPTKEGVVIGEVFPYMNDGDEPLSLEVMMQSPLGKDTITIPITSMEPGTKYVYKILFNKLDDVRISVRGVEWNGEEEMVFDENGSPIQ